MGKPDLHYVCQSCGAVSAKWAGKCEACGAWNTMAEEALRSVVPGALSAPPARKGKGLAFADLAGLSDPPPRLSTAIGELDRVLGGGLVAASAVLVGGDPGVGKSTLLLQAAAGLARRGAGVAYITGEEAEAQVQDRARRLAAQDSPVKLAAETDLRKILDGLKAARPDVVIVDSIQTMWADGIDAAPGTVTQVRACAHELVRFAKKSGAAVLLVGHVTKDGQIAGGLRITEPAADLAVAAALISALMDEPLPADSVAFGEIALSGDVRPVGRMELRLKEAAKLGFKSAFAPAGAEGDKVRVRETPRIADLAAHLGSAGR